MSGYLDAECVIMAMVAAGIIKQTVWKQGHIDDLFYYCSFFLEKKTALIVFEIRIIDGRHCITCSNLTVIASRHSFDVSAMMQKCTIGAPNP
jgi:hypothetical protein